MSRFAHMFFCTAALALCLVALPLVSTGQQPSTDSQGRSLTTVPPTTSSPSSKVMAPGAFIPEGTVTIYSNFAPSYSYDPNDGWTESGPDSGVGPFMQAMAFTPTKGTYLLTRLDVALGWISGTNGYTLELRADRGGVPGRKIAAWRVTGLPTFGSNNTIETIRVHDLILLLPRHQYWLVPVPASDEWGAWNENTVIAAGNGALSVDGGATWTPTSFSPNGAFDVLGLRLF